MTAAQYYEWRTPGLVSLNRSREMSSKGFIGFLALASKARGSASPLSERWRNVMELRFLCSTERNGLDYALKSIFGQLDCFASAREPKDGTHKKRRAF